MRTWLLVLLAGCASESKPPPERPVPRPSSAPGAETDATMVEPSILEARRIEGSMMIPPDDIDKYRMVERKLTRVSASLKLCLGVTGEPSSVTLLKSSGLPGYDKKLQSRVSEWRYKPFEINGSPAPVCTAVSFIYNQPLPQPR